MSSNFDTFDTVQRLVQYYRRCYQASFQTTQGEGIFNDKNIVPMFVSNETPFYIHGATEAILKEWLVDQENYHLVCFRAFKLYPTSNKYGTTDVCYFPGSVSDFLTDLLEYQKDISELHYSAIFSEEKYIKKLFPSDATLEDLIRKVSTLDNIIWGKFAKVNADQKPDHNIAEPVADYTSFLDKSVEDRLQEAAVEHQIILPKKMQSPLGNLNVKKLLEGYQKIAVKNWLPEVCCGINLVDAIETGSSAKDLLAELDGNEFSKTGLENVLEPKPTAGCLPHLTGQYPAIAAEDFESTVMKVFSELGIHEEFEAKVDNPPEPKQLAGWLSRYAKKIKEPVTIYLNVVALVPRDYRSVEYKQELMQHLDRIAEEYASSTSLISNLLRRTDLFSYRYTQRQQTEKELAATSLPFLSTKQNQALTNALNYPVSCVQGPPGTGKSYVLAVLASVLAGSGKSVLIATHSDHALSVIRDKLVQDIGIEQDLIAHFGNGRRNGRFAEQLRRLFKADGRFNDQTKTVNEKFSRIRSEIDSLTGQLSDLVQKTPVFDEDLLGSRGTFSAYLKRFFLRMRYGDQPKIAQKIVKLHSQLQQCRDLLGQKTSATLAAKFSQAYREDKSVWGAVSQQIGKTSVRSAITAAQKKYHNEFELQQGMGLWLMSLEDIVQNTHGSFDYLIIDEATQVNLASTIPALNIAENLIVLGDTKQLRHYSFLSNEQEKRIAERLELPEGSYASFRSTSFLDYIDDYLAQIGKMEAITLLDEHYRSAPPLMQFNSDQFYEGNVQVLTGFSSKNRLHALHLDWQMVPGGVWEEKTNVQEANALIVFLQNLIANEKSQSHKTTIGVLSFFSAQAEYLKKNLLTRLSTEEIRQHQIKIGTPFSFQGEERDQMLISCTVDDEVHHGTWNYLNKPDVFNVATSRARRLQTLFLSATPGKLPVSSLLRQYYQFSRPDNLTSEPVTPESWLVELTAKLKQAGFNVEYQHKIADIDIDLILEKNGQMLAVDLIGFPGDVGEAVHLKRYKALFRAGIPLYPLLAVEWLLHQDDSIVDLLNWIRELQSRLSYNAEHLSSISEPSIATGTEELAVLIFPDHLLLLNQLLQAPELNRAVEFNIAAQVTTLSNISQLLAQMFEVTSLSYQRYQASINAAVKKYLDNLITFQMLYKQVWESTGADHSYWNTLIQPIRARHQELTNALAKMLIELQQQIAKSDSEDKLLLDDLDELAERLKNY